MWFILTVWMLWAIIVPIIYLFSTKLAIGMAVMWVVGGVGIGLIRYTSGSRTQIENKSYVKNVKIDKENNQWK